MHTVLLQTVGERHLVGFQTRLEIIIQRQSLADVGQRHVVAALFCVPSGARIGQIDMQFVGVPGKADAHRAGLA